MERVGATAAHRDLVRLHPFTPVADRVWEPRDDLTSYDGWYVALAEAMGATVLTLERRLAAAPGRGLAPGHSSAWRSRNS